jgi:hypothetical protein
MSISKNDSLFYLKLLIAYFRVDRIIFTTAAQQIVNRFSTFLHNGVIYLTSDVSPRLNLLFSAEVEEDLGRQCRTWIVTVTLTATHVPNFVTVQEGEVRE